MLLLFKWLINMWRGVQVLTFPTPGKITVVANENETCQTSVITVLEVSSRNLRFQKDEDMKPIIIRNVFLGGRCFL